MRGATDETVVKDHPTQGVASDVLTGEKSTGMRSVQSYTPRGSTIGLGLCLMKSLILFSLSPSPWGQDSLIKKIDLCNFSFFFSVPK